MKFSTQTYLESFALLVLKSETDVEDYLIHRGLHLSQLSLVITKPAVSLDLHSVLHLFS